MLKDLKNIKEELSSDDISNIKILIRRMLLNLFRILYSKPGFWQK